MIERNTGFFLVLVSPQEAEKPLVLWACWCVSESVLDAALHDYKILF